MTFAEGYTITQLVAGIKGWDLMGYKVFKENEVALTLYDSQNHLGHIVWTVEDWNRLAPDKSLKVNMTNKKEVDLEHFQKQNDFFAILKKLNLFMTTTDIARELGVSSSTVNNWLKKKNMPSKDNQRKILSLLDTDKEVPQ